MLWLTSTSVFAQVERVVAPDSVASEQPMPEVVPDSTARISTEMEIAPNEKAITFEGPDIWDTGVSPTGAVLMTPLFPGWGQLYTDNSWRAALSFGVEMFYWSNMLMRDRRAIRSNNFASRFEGGSTERDFYRAQADENWEQVRDFAWWSGGILLIIALDAYVGAHLFDFDEDPVPVPNDWDGVFGNPVADMPGASPSPQIVVFQWAHRF